MFKGTVDIPGRKVDEVQKRILTFMRLLKAEAPGSKVSIAMTDKIRSVLSPRLELLEMFKGKVGISGRKRDDMQKRILTFVRL